MDKEIGTGSTNDGFSMGLYIYVCHSTEGCKYIYMHINVCIFSVCVKKLCFPGTTSGNTSCHLMEIITIQEICIYILFRYGFLHNMCRPIFT